MGHSLYVAVLLLGALAMLAAAGAAEVDPLRVMEPLSFTAADGTKLPYRLLKPAAVEPERAYPLVLFLHGAGGRGHDNRGQIADQPIACRQLVNEPLRSRYPCYVVAPQCPANRFWADWTLPAEKLTRPTRELRAALELLAALRGQFNIDPQHIHLTGLSMGGCGSFVLLADQPHLFAGAVIVCGGGNPSHAARFAKVPLWAFHGGADGVVPARRSRDMIDAMRAAGGAPRYTVYPKVGHDSWRLAYKEPGVWEWLFGCRRR